MSAVKIIARGVLLTGILASSTLAGSMSAGPDPSSQGPRTRIVAAESLSGNWVGFGTASNGWGSSWNGGSQGGIALGTTGSAPSTTATPMNYGASSLRLAGTTSGSSSSQPVSWQPASPSAPSTPPQADALINFGSGPFPDASTLTTGNPQSFLNSPVFSRFYGPNGPTSQDVANFQSQVVATVQKTYDNAGLPIDLTTDPKVSAAHTLSVVSNASNPETPGAIGITAVGGDGYTFLDKFGAAQSSSQLATAVGHNVAHELMHAFGVADHPESGGPYVDAATTTFSSLADPSTGFSSSAASLLSTLDFKATNQVISSGSQVIEGGQVLVPEASPVPEPSTIALWTLAGLSTIAYHRRKSA